MAVADDSTDVPAAPDHYDLHENKLIDLVNYVRSNTIRNEQQFCLLMLAYTSGLFENPQYYISACLIGTSSSGKSHIKQNAEDLLEHLNVFSADTGSEKSMIHADAWGDADVVSMGELQQPPEELIEFLKRVHGGDETFEYSVTTGSMRDGFDAEVIEKEAKMYAFTYAQWEPDFELWNRLLKIPAHESESKNRAVMRMAFDEEGIQIEGDDVEYGYPFEAGERELRKHMVKVKQAAPDHATIPKTHDGDAFPVTEILEPIFNHSRSESNRIYWMVANLLRASAALNYEDRATEQIRYDGEPREATVIAPQDVANIVRLRPALLATTHELDDRKRAILQAIRDQGGRHNEVDGVAPIREWLKESDAPEVKQDELKNIIRDLESNFLVDVTEDGGQNGDLYRAYQLDKLGVPNIDEYAHLFEDCTDPLTGEPFLDVWPEQRDRNLTDAQELLSKVDDVSAGGDTIETTEDGDAGLNNFGTTEPTTTSVGPHTYALAEMVAEELDGVRIQDLSDVPIEAFLGLVDPNDPDLAGVSTDGTLLDPSRRDVWDQAGKDDSWVETETHARRELQASIETLIGANAIGFSEVHERVDGNPVDVTLTVDLDVIEEA